MDVVDIVDVVPCVISFILPSSGTSLYRSGLRWIHPGNTGQGAGIHTERDASLSHT